MSTHLDELRALREENDRLRAALRVNADALSGILKHGLPRKGRGHDAQDSHIGAIDDLVAATQSAYAALAGISLAEWASAHPGLYDSPPGPIQAPGGAAAAQADAPSDAVERLPAIAHALRRFAHVAEPLVADGNRHPLDIIAEFGEGAERRVILVEHLRAAHAALHAPLPEHLPVDIRNAVSAIARDYPPPEDLTLPEMTERGPAGQIFDLAWPHFGGDAQSGDFWPAFGAGVEFALTAFPPPGPTWSPQATWLVKFVDFNCEDYEIFAQAATPLDAAVAAYDGLFDGDPESFDGLADTVIVERTPTPGPSPTPAALPWSNDRRHDISMQDVARIVRGRAPAMMSNPAP